MTEQPILPQPFKISNMKNWIFIYMLLTGNYLFAQVIPVGFIKKGVYPSTGTNPVTENLLLYLDATRTASYGGTGTTWTDISGQSNNATLSGSPTFESGSFTFAENKYALTSQKITTSLSSATFIAWVNPSEWYSGTTLMKVQENFTGIIFSRGGKGQATNPTSGLNFFKNSVVGYSWNDNYSSWPSNLVVPNYSWSMIALTISSTQAVVYLCNSNGIYSATNVASHLPVSGFNFFIGHDPAFGPTGRILRGKIATSMVYSTALTSPQITQIFNAQKAAFGL
jgi:hypothetical protein